MNWCTRTIEIVPASTAGGKPKYRIYVEGAYEEKALRRQQQRDEQEAAEEGHQDEDEADTSALGTFDVVVIATPLVTTSLGLVESEGGERVVLQGPPMEMQTTISTFVEASLREGERGGGGSYARQ